MALEVEQGRIAEAKSAIEDYLASLNRLADRELLRPDTFKIAKPGARRRGRQCGELDIPVEFQSFNSGGRYRDRTCGPFHVKEVLSR